jgi:hypothetical protein
MPRRRWSKRRVVNSGSVAIRPLCRFKAGGIVRSSMSVSACAIPTIRSSMVGRGKAARSAVISGHHEITNSMRKTPSPPPQRLQTGRPEALARGNPSYLPYPILRSMSRPRIATPRLAACRFHRQPQRAGEPLARRASSGRRQRARGCLRGVFRGCAPEGPAIKCLLIYLYAPPAWVTPGVARSPKTNGCAHGPVNRTGICPMVGDWHSHSGVGAGYAGADRARH